MLSELLDVNQPLFRITLEQLERSSGNPSVDVRLTAEIIGKAHQKTKELGLDPHDTTGTELYLALKELVKKHDRFIAERLGADDPSDVNDVLPRLKALMEQIEIPKSAWVLKHSSAKRLLRDMPPKKVMNHLRYRSIDSMLKREPIGEIYGALRFAETHAWMEAFLQKYDKLSPQDFETRQIEFILLDGQKWGHITESFVRRNRHNITHLKELGTVIILPLPISRMPGVAITVLPQLLHYVNEIRLYSAYFKMQQVSSQFGKLLSRTISIDPGNHAVVAGQSVHWRTVQRHFGNRHPSEHPEIFEPHVQPEDLEWRKAEEVLYRIEPALYFWRDMDFVATTKHGRLVSFNMMDVAASYVNDLPYGQQSVHYFRQSLWNELMMRYIGQPPIERQILKQLDTETVEPGLLFSMREMF